MNNDAEEGCAVIGCALMVIFMFIVAGAGVGMFVWLVRTLGGI